MKHRSKQGFTILLTLLLLVSAWQSNIFTAQAFSVRKTKPSGKDSHYYSGANPFYAGGYLNECTWYVWGRAYEALGAKPNLPTVAAHRWYQDNKNRKACSYGTTPKVGAVMITVKDESHGHVAFVEELYSNGTMLISEFNYNVHNGFSTQVIKQLSAGAKRGRKHKVLGYIYVTAAKPADTVAPTISGVKAKKKQASGFELAAKASDKNGVAAVKFQVRAGDQSWKDAVWFNATRSSEDDCWTCRVSVSDLNNAGRSYTVRCYAYDKAGNKTTKDITVSLPVRRQSASKAQNKSADVKQMSLFSNGRNGGASGRFSLWSAEQTSDDAALSSENSFRERRLSVFAKTADANAARLSGGAAARNPFFGSFHADSAANGLLGLSRFYAQELCTRSFNGSTAVPAVSGSVTRVC